MVGISGDVAIDAYVIRFVRSVERFRAEEIEKITK